MLKETTFKEKISLIDRFFPDLIDAVKKEIKTEHLKNDRLFVSRYLASKNINKLTLSELATAYRNAILSEEAQASENLGYFLTNRWILKNADIYDFFESSLSKISENFSELDVLPEEQAMPIMMESVSHFGAPKTYLFAVLNSVVFPENVYKKLRELTHEAANSSQELKEKLTAAATVEQMQRNHQAELARLSDKYEKKVAGLERKYHNDVEALKKQIANLQRKLNETAV